jgi:hypothetical protein
MRLIDADALIISLAKDRSALVNNHVPYGELRRIDETIWKVAESPTISAVPVVRGEWMPAKDPYDRVYCYRHAGCGCEHNEQSAYCPNCGAKMSMK